ncbi:Fe-S cluster assembly protein IscX [Pseudomonas glycinis]|jgi:FeS assembly protein IscX|uniref:Fe-S cluster assembly protein IscX n=5 Tax=Pseudomonas TaxID=286 RepID=A0A923FQR5_9PSED|nr:MULTISPECIES: Fe-S cluster assembly protein IscX [Pseudomonas]WKV83266.1 Fe-S cluster assembly protein IscX [Pseudomonas sp. B24_DOA]WKV88831.1 Fe-S cluster assembly protein IscX [Pseudomonas sp. B21_DOA]AMT90648.1 Fe-S assembly protein IscX [Pseudomonas koreensis]KAB2527711.1 Fe-S cluster assembly protein IscX [Pseudomonas sp. GXM4]KIF60066.1 FeS assembly protein IscX [Pseudomonas fluorescens]
MSYGWNDVQRIAEELAEAHEGLDPYSVGFVRLQQMILELPDFDATSGRVGEKVLEAVQELWAAELD